MKAKDVTHTPRSAPAELRCPACDHRVSAEVLAQIETSPTAVACAFCGEELRLLVMRPTLR